MTQIQNARRNNKENERTNRANEELSAQRNKTAQDQLTETKRSNKAQERLARARNTETERANRANELFRGEQLELQKKTAIGNAIGSAIGGIGTAALLFNDVEWYVDSVAEAESILNLPSEDALGTQYPPNVLDSMTRGVDRHFEYSGPSILAMVIAPTIGRSDTIYSAANRAAAQLWTKVNERNGRNSSYADADMLMYQLGVSGMIALEGYIERLYDWSNKWSETNAMLPRGMIEAMGMDFDSVKKNRYQLHSMLEDLRNFISAYRLVPHFNIANRWYFTMKTALTDLADASRPQWYVYVPAGFLRLDVSGSETRLVLEDWIGADRREYDERHVSKWTPKHSVDDLYDLVQRMMNSFFTAQDVKIMNSDIIAEFGDDATKPFGANSLYPFDSMPSVSTDSTALYQFRNARSSVWGVTPSSYTITEKFETVNDDSGAAVGYVYASAPSIDGDAGISPDLTDNGFLIEAGVELASAAHFVEETRLIPVATIIGGEGLQDAFFAEVPCGLTMTKMLYNIGDGDYGTLRMAHYNFSMNALMLRSEAFPSQEEASRIASALEAAFAFKYAPIRKVQVQFGTTEADLYERTMLTTQWENTVWVPAETLRKANNRIALRMLGAKN